MPWDSTALKSAMARGHGRLTKGISIYIFPTGSPSARFTSQTLKAPTPPPRSGGARLSLLRTGRRNRVEAAPHQVLGMAEIVGFLSFRALLQTSIKVDNRPSA
jgi:hypothetical protein